MTGELVPTNPGEFLLYQTTDGQTRIQVRVEGETVWLSQRDMAELFQTTPQNVTMHIASLYEEGELTEAATCKEYLQVRSEGERQVQRSVKHYNLDVIISVGYRVKSLRGTQFRIWATQRLREYLIKGFTLDDDRLKKAGGGNYFDELLDRIRDIRSSELQARGRKPMYMKDWIAKLDDFIRLSDRDLLTHAGTISHETAAAKAEIEYEKYRQIQAALPQPVDAHGTICEW